MAKTEKRNLFLNEFALREFKNKFHNDLAMNFFSYKHVIVSKSCYTRDLPQLLGNLNGIVVNEWKEEKSVFDVLIVSAIDIEEMKKGNFFNDVFDALVNINKRQKIIDRFKVSANVYILDERDFLSFYNNRSAYIDEFKTDDYDYEKLYNAMTIVPIVTAKGLFEEI